MAIRPLNSIAGFSTGDPAVTVVQANGDVTTTNLTANGVSNLGNVGNVRIFGGSTGQFLTTDGGGSLSFGTISTSSISNGNSNVNIPAANGNIQVSVAGNANVAVFTGTGANLANLDVTGVSNLGNVGNVKITGGNADQYLRTDGAGNLSWDDIGNIAGNSAAPMPYFIAANTSFIVNEFKQGLYTQPIEIDGELVVDGMLIEIQDTIQSQPTQILFDTNGVATGNTGFTFLSYNGNLNVPGNINATGNIIPGADDVYDLGRANARWRNGYFGGNTLYLDTASISVDANGFVVIRNELGGEFIVEGNTSSGTFEIENGNSNVRVYANGNVATTVAGVANIMVVTTAGANLTGNLTTGGVKTDNLYYANGTAWNFGQDPGGSNTQIQFNDDANFAGSANFTFNKTTNNLTVTGNIVSSTGAIYGNAAGLTQIPAGNINGQVANALVAGTIYTASQPNITSVGTLTDLSVSGNGTIGGNLVVNGNLVYVNVEELAIKDPIINLQTGPNGAPLVSNTNKDVGSALNYYDTQARIAFMGWDNSNAEFAFGSQTTISSEVVTFTTLGNVRAQTFKGNVEATTIAGNLTTAAQPNITSVGTQTSSIVIDGEGLGVTVDASGLRRVGLMKYLGLEGALVHSNTIPLRIGRVSTANVSNGNSVNFTNEIFISTDGNIGMGGNITPTHTVSVTGTLNVSANANVGNIGGANTISANYLISNSGCVSVNGAMLAYDSGTGAAGIFSSLATDINFGLAANITAGSTTGTTTIRGNLVVNNNVYANTGTVKGSLLTGTLTTASQPNITSVGTLTSLSVTGNISANNATTNTVTTNSTISKRANIAVTTDTVIDSFSASAYRTAKYVIKSENDDGYESLEVLLVHNNINSYVTVYAAINDGGGNTVSITTGISSGNVELRATGLAANTVVNCIGTYVPD